MKNILTKKQTMKKAILIFMTILAIGCSPDDVKEKNDVEVISKEIIEKKLTNGKYRYFIEVKLRNNTQDFKNGNITFSVDMGYNNKWFGSIPFELEPKEINTFSEGSFNQNSKTNPKITSLVLN